ncbi:hypothetical protein L873DRAFT_1831405 [Choiromyces venosus 120613-1]|uniref:Uncharacterized protein n=1 Tax=Choiromyces venosus 120613-1 TaxID=1336337 RepID=A0A3N4J4L8_9PEZI|nr:hypothetical protein L873DRAFT_1831405 [Choiromyces venosus 120613-1]
MPPPNTWSHYFLTSRVLHFYVSISVLLVLGTWASVTNFLRTTERGREIEGELAWSRPVESVEKFLAAYRLHAHERSLLVAEIRRRKVEDVDKRGAYRRAHGLGEESRGDAGWGVKLGQERVERGRMIRGLDKDVGVEESPTGGKGGWVEEEIRRAEEEVESAVAAAAAGAGAGSAGEVAEAVVVPVQEVKEEGEKKKGSWWSRG